MKRVICEVCGGSDILKADGVFTCQSCGCKYSLEEVRKLLSEDDSGERLPGVLSYDDSTEDYANTLKAARDAMTDGRFDSAYSSSIVLIAIKPDVPELIAMQALAILGKDKMTRDIPSPTLKGMERFHAMFGTWRAQYSEQVTAIRNVRNYVATACQAQLTAFREEMSELKSKQSTPSIEDGLTQLGDAIGMLNGDLYSTMHGIDVERDDRWRDEENRHLDDQIEKAKEKERKVEAFKSEQTDKLDKLYQSAQSAYAQAQQGDTDASASRQDNAELFTVINDQEIICNRCGTVQPIRRIKGVCWKCGVRLSDGQGVDTAHA